MYSVQAGESALSELGLISWWKPSSYFRIALESVHTYGDLPWWATIITATIILRLILISVPIMSQRLVAKQSKYKKELDEFRQRMDDARNEGNNLLQQQIFLEQRDFLKSKDIRLGRQLLIMLANGGVFATQFFAIKKMVEFGIEVGTSYEQMTPGFRLGMQYGLPVIIFAVSSQFASVSVSLLFFDFLCYKNKFPYRWHFSKISFLYHFIIRWLICYSCNFFVWLFLQVIFDIFIFIF
uniref:DUF106 domain-containing protein n=1 Tax=Heterorhabditis bacteriophora TaxID=37862 RepID=A0A1I7XGW5_HETBA